MCTWFCTTTYGRSICNAEDIGIWLNNIDAFLKTQEHHILLLDKIIHLLEADDFTIKLHKCGWTIKESDWLGYLLMPTWLKPWHKNWESPLNEKNKISITNARLSWCCQSSPPDVATACPYCCYLVQQFCKKTFRWNPDMGHLFKHMKAFLAQYCILASPYHNKAFHIYTDASNNQTGASIPKMIKLWCFGCVNLTTHNSNIKWGMKNLFPL